MNVDSLPSIDAFLRQFGDRAGWNAPSVERLRSAGEETLSSIVQGEDSGNRLIVNARRDGGTIELEFVATQEGANLEDRLAYLSDQPEIEGEEEISFRLLRHYASSVRHRKYHDVDIVTVQVVAD